MERGWGQRVGWGVTSFLGDLSLPAGTLAFSPGGPKRFEPSQSSMQSKVSCRACLRWSGLEAVVCARWDRVSWALAENSTGQRLLLFLTQAGSEFASLFPGCSVSWSGFNCRVPHPEGHGRLLCPLLSTVGVLPSSCLTVAPASLAQKAAAS